MIELLDQIYCDVKSQKNDILIATCTGHKKLPMQRTKMSPTKQAAATLR